MIKITNFIILGNSFFGFNIIFEIIIDWQLEIKKNSSTFIFNAVVQWLMKQKLKSYQKLNQGKFLIKKLKKLKDK